MKILSRKNRKEIIRQLDYITSLIKYRREWTYNGIGTVRLFDDEWKDILERISYIKLTIGSDKN
jgi:hypothetical protein